MGTLSTQTQWENSKRKWTLLPPIFNVPFPSGPKRKLPTKTWLQYSLCPLYLSPSFICSKSGTIIENSTTEKCCLVKQIFVSRRLERRCGLSQHALGLTSFDLLGSIFSAVCKNQNTGSICVDEISWRFRCCEIWNCGFMSRRILSILGVFIYCPAVPRSALMCEYVLHAKSI